MKAANPGDAWERCVNIGQSEWASERSQSPRALGEGKEIERERGRLDRNGPTRAGADEARAPIRVDARGNQSGWRMGTSDLTNLGSRAQRAGCAAVGITPPRDCESGSRSLRTSSWKGILPSSLASVYTVGSRLIESKRLVHSLQLLLVANLGPESWSPAQDFLRA